ncbi:MAG: 1-(5-phosphoribosyl)-5-[(5-phosphoribosylamino)methylideneamino]imidazole-4-carboxamide isomerase [Firmicutes bacterium]|nr:1-(5-phosphoribosyl)-5-[(5-phosphoribosylamino)methylideneamino]imidazole-4-carboxamide isomerase [Bacillota bacterium]
MIIIPAIDIKRGECVRLKQGKFSELTTYFKDPIKVAKKWETEGFKCIHIVDLDGALKGNVRNLEVIKNIVNSVNIPIQLGGGIRNEKTVRDLLNLGVNRVILGTAAIKNRELLKELVKNYGEKIIVSIDVKDRFIAVDGWTQSTRIKDLDFIKDIEKLGVKTIVYTDISKDGMMEGPNFQIYKELKEKTSINIIASGGVSSIKDIKRLKKSKVEGAIVGKALYTGKINLEKLKELGW